MAYMILWILLLSGCAVLPRPTRSNHSGVESPEGRCADFFAAIDRQTQQSGVLDSGYARVQGYPYLRVDRFLASFRHTVDNENTFSAWVDQMQALDQRARTHEINNWTESDRLSIEPENEREAILRRVQSCGDQLKAIDFEHDRSREALQNAAVVPDEYLSFRRALGLYPITRLFVLHGVNLWHTEARDNFSVEPRDGPLSIRYLPETVPEEFMPGRIVERASRDRLGIPAYSKEDLKVLFGLYAPVWDVRTHGDDDRIGTPVWQDHRRIAIDVDRPKTYTLVSFTRFGDDILTQLNYVIWFPSRPKNGVFDIYGGLLDGINYRVTLAPDGFPLLYETIHNCGCYYKAYPTKRLQRRGSTGYAEQPLILEAPDMHPGREMMTISLESRTHYVQHLYPVSRNVEIEAVHYTFSPYDKLRSLPYLDGFRRSLFDQYGIVPGTERPERYILWPTGVLSPGAMRQWGRQAVALIGEHHFDDPFYLDRMFVQAAAQ